MPQPLATTSLRVRRLQRERRLTVRRRRRIEALVADADEAELLDAIDEHNDRVDLERMLAERRARLSI